MRFLWERTKSSKTGRKSLERFLRAGIDRLTSADYLEQHFSTQTLELTTTAYGTWSGGRFMHFGETLSEERFIGCVETAYESGIRTFITSDVYGNGKADELLGKALKGIDRSSYCLVGMIGHDFYEGQRQGSRGYPRFTDPELRGPDGYSAFIRTATGRSLERCGTDRFDLLMLHNPDEIGYTSEILWQAMDQARQEGMTDRLGIAPGPANGFTLDLIGCFERFGELIDWFPNIFQWNR